MSWLRSALHKAADVAGGKGLSGASSHGGSVGRARLFVHSAGAAVAKAVLDRTGERAHNNFRHAVRRLDEVALAARGAERRQALARWLAALRDLAAPPRDHRDRDHRDREGDDPEDGDDPTRVATVLFYDPEISSEPLTFRDVFLQSNALENITISLILEPPEDEEVALVLEMFGLCLLGGPELHNAIMSGIQDLGKGLANYSELLLRADDLLRMAADVITGLKISAEVERLEAEAGRAEAQAGGAAARVKLKRAPAHAEVPRGGEGGVLSDPPRALTEGAAASEELLRCAARRVEAARRAGEVLGLRQGQGLGGDTEEVRRLKLEKLKTLAEDLQAGAREQKAKITESRQQKSEAMAFRVTKVQEVAEAEKVIAQEMQVLQRRREELEAELAQVMQAIAVQTKKHIQLQEEKEHFDDASTDIVAKLAIQEEELLKLMSQHSTEAGVAATWRSFLEDTWQLQASCVEAKEKTVKEAMKETRVQFWQVAIGHLVYRQEELDALLIRLKMYNEELTTIRAKKADLEKKGMDGIVADITSGRKLIEEKYVEIEAQVKNALVAVERAKADLKISMEAIPADDDEEERKTVEELAGSLDVLRRDFDAMKRPKLALEAPPPRAKKAAMAGGGAGRGPPGGARALAPQGPPESAGTRAAVASEG